ncbi:hypothetical protein [Herbidospora sp. NBRC 101105]|nr:hypothetical protein [Herbidospora sp. NBRC 101105]
MGDHGRAPDPRHPLTEIAESSRSLGYPDPVTRVFSTLILDG